MCKFRNYIFIDVTGYLPAHVLVFTKVKIHIFIDE